jgi:hypothetical protein
MTESRTVTCPECGFQLEDRGPLDWPAFRGDAGSYSDLCHHLDEAPEPPGNDFYCMSLRTAAKRAAMASIGEIGRPGLAEAHLPLQANGAPALGVPPAVEEKGHVIGEP